MTSQMSCILDNENAYLWGVAVVARFTEPIPAPVSGRSGGGRIMCDRTSDISDLQSLRVLPAYGLPAGQRK